MEVLGQIRDINVEFLGDLCDGECQVGWREEDG